MKIALLNKLHYKTQNSWQPASTAAAETAALNGRIDFSSVFL